MSVLSALESEMVVIRHLVGGLLAELEDDIDRDKFKRLLHYSRRLGSFQNRAKLVSSIPMRVFQSAGSWHTEIIVLIGSSSDR
jgi:hypothetical protein